MRKPIFFVYSRIDSDTNARESIVADTVTHLSYADAFIDKM